MFSTRHAGVQHEPERQPSVGRLGIQTREPAVFSVLNDSGLVRITHMRLALPQRARSIRTSCQQIGKEMKLYTRIQARLNSMQNEDGATAVEYGLIVSLIAVFIIGAVGAVGIALDALFTEVEVSL